MQVHPHPHTKFTNEQQNNMHIRTLYSAFKIHNSCAAPQTLTENDNNYWGVGSEGPTYQVLPSASLATVRHEMPASCAPWFL